MQKILQEQKLVPTPVPVLNKPGGNQTLAASRELAKYLETQYAQTRSVLVELGLAK